MTEAAAASRDAHLYGPGPKRILALDGGGVRGVVTLAFLERIEKALERTHGQSVRLCDYFDLIGGTSTGAIIAAGLALGYSASVIRKFYEEMAPAVFRKSHYRFIGFQAKFDASHLKRELDRLIGDRTLDTPDLLTGLAVITKRLDTGSAWVLLNNERSSFWETPADNSFKGNRHIRLVDLVRASAAAPHFFDPELIEIVEGQPPGLFIDGALTPHNNPSLQLFLSVVLTPFGLNWRTGVSELSVVSIGTGSWRPRLSHAQARRAGPLGLAVASLAAEIADNQQLVLTLMSWLGQTNRPLILNSELGDLGGAAPSFGNLFRFSRYDISLEDKWLSDNCGRSFTPKELARLRAIDDPNNISELFYMADLAAQEQVRDEDWRPAPQGAAPLV